MGLIPCMHKIQENVSTPILRYNVMLFVMFLPPQTCLVQREAVMFGWPWVRWCFWKDKAWMCLWTEMKIVLSGQVCFRPTPLMCYGALSCFSCSWLWEQLTKPEPRRLVGSRASSVGGMRGSSWPKPLLQEQLEANRVHMRSEPLVFISAQGASETYLCSILQQTVCCEGILTSSLAVCTYY